MLNDKGLREISAPFLFGEESGMRAKDAMTADNRLQRMALTCR
jgi:hypothetical protein